MSAGRNSLFRTQDNMFRTPSDVFWTQNNVFWTPSDVFRTQNMVHAGRSHLVCAQINAHAPRNTVFRSAGTADSAAATASLCGIPSS